MKRAQIAKTPDHVDGKFTVVSSYQYTLTTARGSYSGEMNSFSGLSRTEKRFVVIKSADGQRIIDFEYIRKHLKAGMRCNVTGYGSWDSEEACVEAMFRHYVAWFEGKQVAA